MTVEENTACKKISQSKLTDKIFCSSNAGTSKLATNVDVDVLNFKKLLNLIKINKIKPIIVGPENIW